MNIKREDSESSINERKVCIIRRLREKVGLSILKGFGHIEGKKERIGDGIKDIFRPKNFRIINGRQEKGEGTE